MHIKNEIPLVRITLSGIMLLAAFFSFFDTSNVSLVSAQNSLMATPAFPLPTNHILSDGQFVYGPNIGDFSLNAYINTNAPHLLKYADDLYGRAEYYSINPKIYLTLLEIHFQLISNPHTGLIDDPFGLNNNGFISQIDILSEKMIAAYYLHLYSFSVLPVSQRSLPSFVTSDGTTINVPPDTNAGTYAVIAGLAAINQKNISLILDNSQINGFYQTYIRLFGNDDPLDEKNQIFMPGEVGALGVVIVPPPLDGLLQLPWLRGSSWFFGGVHSDASGGSGTPYVNASALDFSPGGIAWGGDTSNMWVVAAASGIPTKISPCYFSILHSGGWETTYYHIENIQNFSGVINQNDKIGVIANTLAEAICSGGNATGPHLHFTLKHNGALVAINGTPLSGWYVHAGRWEYDTDCNYMWLERAGTKKCANINKVLSEAPPSPPTVFSIVRTDINPSSSTSVNFTLTFSETVTGVDISDFALITTGSVSGAVVSGVGGSANVYTVTVNTGNGDGTIRLDVVDNNSIVDGTFNPLGGVAVGDGNFTTGEIYTINKSMIVTDTWAVKVSPSTNINQLALQLGVQNLGQIGSLTGYYLFRILGSDTQSNAIATKLAANPQVLWFEQQVAHQQSTREITDPIPSRSYAADTITATATMDDVKSQHNVDNFSATNTPPASTQTATAIIESSPVTSQSPMFTQTIAPLIQASPIPTQTAIVQVHPSSTPITFAQSAKMAVLPNEPSLIHSTIPSTGSENNSSNGSTIVVIMITLSLAAGGIILTLRRVK